MQQEHQHGDQALSLSQVHWHQEFDGPCEVSPNGRFRRFGEELEAPLHRRSYRAYDCESGREVSWNVIAVRRLPKGSSLGDSEVRKSLLARLRLLRSLEHPNIMCCVDFWVVKGRLQMVFISELVIGGSLKLHLNKISRPKLKIVKGWCRELLAALEELHHFEEITSLPLVISADTVCVDANQNQLKVGVDAVLLPILNPCCTGGLVPPELADGIYTPAADVFSFGLTLVNIITNKQPYSECKNPYQVCRHIQEGMTPLELEEIGHAELRGVIESCLRSYRTRPNLSELASMQLWSASDANDKLPIPLVGQSLTGSHHQQRLKTKNSLASTKGSVKEVKKISETVERQEKQSEFIFNIQFEERAYQLKALRPPDQPESFERFIQMLSHRLEDKQDNNDNRTLFENETNLFRGSKTYKCLGQRESQMEHTDFTYFNSEALQNTRTAFNSMYEVYRMGLTEPLLTLPGSEEVIEQRLTVEKRELERLHKCERERWQLRRIGRPSQETDLFNMDGQGFETEEYWQRLQTSRNMNEEVLVNYSSILHIRDEVPSVVTPRCELLQLDRNEEFEVNLIRYLTPREEVEETSKRQLPLEPVAEEVPPDELNKSFTEPATD